MGNTKTFFAKIGLWFKNIFVKVDEKDSMLKRTIEKPGFSTLSASVISIIIGLILGYIVLICLDAGNSTNGIIKIITTGFSKPRYFAKVLYQAAPLILTGLSVGFAFKTGLFNIGATGQYTIGAMFALIGAMVWQMPWWACMLLAVVGGALWGAIPGIFKALLNVNEVITSIMFNWIGLFVVNLTITNIPQMLANFYGASNGDRTASLEVANQNAILPKWGLDNLFNSDYMNIGIIIAIVVSILMYVILNKTTFGYELKACGFNRNAAKYAGINAKRNIILSMTIAGALAGIGGGIYYLSGIAEYTLVKSLLPMGFNGIPVALLGASNPIGIIFSGFFISYIQVGGEAMQPEFTSEIIGIIIAVIIYMSALSLIVKSLITKLVTRKKQRESDKILALENNSNKSNDTNFDQENQQKQAGDSGVGILPEEVQKEDEEK